jgi:hypothetical protein
MVMVKKKCGTCRYFDDCQIAGSGHCQHPRRKDLANLVLVRKSELACRNVWDQDLWEPKSDVVAASIVPVDIVVPPAETNGHKPSRAPREVNPTDKLTGIAVAPVAPSPPNPPFRPVPVTDEDLPEPSAFKAGDTHSDVIGAHERFRTRLEDERQQGERAQSSNLSKTHVRPIPPLVPIDHGPAEPKVIRPVPVDRNPRDIPMPSSVVDLNTAPQHGATLEITGGGELRTDATLPTPRNSQTVQRPRQPRDDRTEQFPTRVPETRPPNDPPGQRERVSASPHAASGTNGRTDPKSTRLPGNRQPSAPSPPAEKDPVDRSSQFGRSPRHARDVTVDVRDPIDRVEFVRAIPRCCRTCREFRPVDDGDRGWCASLYAFRERTMVKSDELACRSSIGVWWLPHDDTWLEHADTSHHARPTPLLDDLLRSRTDGFLGNDSRRS